MNVQFKGSQRRTNQVDIEMARLVQEFTEKLEHDPYQPGVVHPEIYPDDLQELVEDGLILRDFQEMTIRVRKNPDGLSISAEVLTRTNG